MIKRFQQFSKKNKKSSINNIQTYQISDIQRSFHKTREFTEYSMHDANRNATITINPRAES